MVFFSSSHWNPVAMSDVTMTVLSLLCNVSIAYGHLRVLIGTNFKFPILRCMQ